ncbi:MAG: ABC transporter permease, partial [Acidobacteria bacterium]|nr:ABC transporter permease [Acidobacteriota bacterium]
MLTHDLRLAFRLILRHPGTSAIAVFTLALGIGATTAIFSVVHAVLLRPLPFPDPDRIVTLWETRPREGVIDSFVSPADFLDWQGRAGSFAAMAALARTTTDLTGRGEPVQLVTGSVTAAFFDVMGTVPMLGRRFAPGDDALGRHRVAILGHGLWQERFGADRHIVGRTIILNGVPHDVVGVLAPSFEFPGERVQLWLPLVLREGAQPPSRNAHFLMVYGRVAPTVSLDQARAEIERIGHELSVTYPADNANHGAGLVPFAERVAGPVRGGLAALMATVLFVLLIACANIANLLLSRAAGRRREMAVRAAIGASRRRLLQQTLIESLVIATMGGAAGLIVASWVMTLLAADTPPALAGLGLDTIGLNATVLVFALAACMGTGIAAGILPAWQLSREESAQSLRDIGRSPAGLKRRVRDALVVGEIALTTLLLVAAGLTLRSFERVLAQPAGFDTAERLTVALTLPRSRYADADAVRRVGREIESRLASVPGVIAAGSNNNLPLTGSDARRGIVVEGFVAQPGEPTRAHIRAVTPDYFRAMGIRLAAGRPLARSDSERAPQVVVINETMARRYWPGQSSVGRRVRLVGEDTWRQVVGVIGDV